MAGRRLDPEDEALWGRVVAGVRPLHVARPRPKPVPVPIVPHPLPVPLARPAKGRVPPPPAPAPRVSPPRADTLDAGWDRRLARGLVSPELTIDLHGDTLAAAHMRLEQGLEQAVAAGVRVLLLVTGRPRDDARPTGRGVIRASVGDWIAASPRAGQVAAVRGAHPRHGGAGALYVVMRRRR